MHPVKTGAKRKRSVLVLVLALGVGLPPPAQAYLLDFTVASINPGVLISYASGYPSDPPLIENNLKVSDVSLPGDLRRQLSPTITLHNKILNFQTGPTPVRGNSFFYAAGSNFTDNKNDGLLAYFGIPHQTANGNFDPIFAASFASAPGAFTGTMVTSGNILNHLAPFSSTLLLLGCGLMGLVGLRYRRRRG